VSDLYPPNLAKFMQKDSANILPSFDKYLFYLYNIHDHGTKQQVSGGFDLRSVRSDYGNKILQYVGSVAWDCISIKI